jgi:hypothetical protein
MKRMTKPAKSELAEKIIEALHGVSYIGYYHSQVTLRDASRTIRRVIREHESRKK